MANLARCRESVRPYCYYLTVHIIKHVLLLLFPRYDAGDHLGVYPVNDPDLVEAIGQRLGADLDEVFTLTNVDGKLLLKQQLSELSCLHYVCHRRDQPANWIHVYIAWHKTWSQSAHFNPVVATTCHCK